MLGNLRINDNYELVYGKTKVMAAKNRIMLDPHWPPREHFKNTKIATEDIHSEIKEYKLPEYNSLEIGEDD